MLGIIIIAALFLILGYPGVGLGQRAYPGYNYGFYGGGLGTILVILLVLWLLGVFR